MNLALAPETRLHDPDPVPILTAKRASAANRRILLVDDDRSVLDLGETVLTQVGYRVDTATDGEEAWAALCTRSYDLLITDNNMPRLTGIGLVKRARQAGMTLPAVVASGALTPEATHSPDWPDATSYLRKPFVLRELLEMATHIVPLVAALAINRLPEPEQRVESTRDWRLNE
jgi:two-component system, chemotaxis family, chemotaxis protein CheY